MKMISYRLAQYKIIENENGDLWWECYADFATTNSGKCFIAGNILFLEPYSEVSEPGYLILEYNELLNKLPRWEKTKYYCSSYTFRPCKTGRILPKKELSKRSRERTERVTNSVTTEVSGNGGIKPKQSDEINAKFKLSGERIENTGRQLISKMWSAATIFIQLCEGDAHIKFKKYINRTQKWIVSMGTRLLFRAGS